MLKKLLLSTGLVGVAFLTGYATAQSYFSNPPSTTLSGDPQASEAAPTEFQSQTQQQQDKKNQALNKQLSQELAKIPPPPPPPAPHEAVGGSPEPTAEAQPAKTPEGGAASSAKTTAPAAPLPSGPTPAAPPITAPSQTQVYTGFQNPQENQTPAQPNSNQNSSGGWNIQY